MTTALQARTRSYKIRTTRIVTLTAAVDGFNYSKMFQARILEARCSANLT